MVRNEAGVGGGDESAPSSSSSSPKNRVKFLCSYGGKIMPRPPDGCLKYVGGETRVIAVPRDINYSDLMKKLSAECEGVMVLKYQVMPEDLDVLVTVKTNEDLKHMLEEYDHLGSDGTPKLRAFLFPANPATTENQTSPRDFYPPEQQYANAVGGMTRGSVNLGLPPVNASRPAFSISASSSPKSTSPESNAAGSVPQELSHVDGNHNSRLRMSKVHSSPSLVSLGNSQPQCNTPNNYPSYRQRQQYYHHQQQQPHFHGYQPPRPSHEYQRITPSFSMGRSEFGRTISVGPIPYNNSGRHIVVSGPPRRYGYYDEYYASRPRAFDGSYSVPDSPRGTG